jgi:LmbE family N-acetylglucosaminyl deacetylase
MNISQPTLLAIYAHPDDEVLGAGGTLAAAANAGIHVAIVVATRGEAGEIQRPGSATPETLPHVRELEMRCSARALGVSELIFLDYRDSGMEGTVENDHPNAFINADAGQVQDEIVAIIRRLRPQVVVTFEPYGGYGHPDHRAINRHTLAALQLSADPHSLPGVGEAWETPRLFYHLLPRLIFRKIRDRVAELGGDTSDFDEMLTEPAAEVWPEDQIHAVVDVSNTIEQKWAAWHCHRTQFGPNSRFRRLPDAEMKRILNTEYFAMAHPAPEPATLLSGLFEDLN